MGREEHFRDWRRRIEDWEGAVGRLLFLVNPVGSGQFTTLNWVPKIDPPNPLSQEHAKTFREHNERLARLEKFIERYCP